MSEPLDCCLDSPCNAGMKIVIVLCCASHYYTFLSGLLALLIPNTTVNHTITYTNLTCIVRHFEVKNEGRRHLEDFRDGGENKTTGQPIDTSMNDKTYRAVM